jgi:hypothetical protein
MSSSPERPTGVIASLRVLAGLALGFVVLTPGPARAAESYDSCTGFVTALPFTIKTPGTWCLTQNLANGGIYIESDNVTLDCDGFRIDAPANADIFTTGVASAQRANITVRNCHIRGSGRGIDLNDFSGAPSQRHVVEDNRIEGSLFIGIFVHGQGSVVRRNQVLDTVSPPLEREAVGIWTVGDVDVIDNLVSGVRAGDNDVFGIQTQHNKGGSLRGNRIRGVRRTSGAGAIRGIFNGTGTTRVILRGNTITGEGQAGSVGVYCESALGRARGNAIKGFPTGIVTCINDGNVIKP